jgi:protease-4
MGLADQTGNLDYVAREVIKAEELVDYTRRENVAERLAKKFGAAIGEARSAPCARFPPSAVRAIPAIR